MTFKPGDIVQLTTRDNAVLYPIAIVSGRGADEERVWLARWLRPNGEWDGNGGDNAGSWDWRHVIPHPDPELAWAAYCASILTE